jgi:hypothetical protein
MTAPIDINRTTLSAALPAEVSREIWSDVQSESIVQRLCRRAKMPGAASSSRSSFRLKDVAPVADSIIEPFSKQFLRDLPALYNECRTRLPGALAKKFDRTALGFDEPPATGSRAWPTPLKSTSKATVT